MLRRGNKPKPQHAAEYASWWTQGLQAAAVSLGLRWPAGMDVTHWRHVTGMDPIKAGYKHCPFFLSSKNDMVLYYTGFMEDGYIGVGFKKDLDEQVGPELGHCTRPFLILVV